MFRAVSYISHKAHRQPHWLGNKIALLWMTYRKPFDSRKDEDKKNITKAVDKAFVLMTGLHNTSAVHSGKFLAPVGVEIGLLVFHGFLTD